jgi:putative PIN family toxin of toxin-antitoxin system
VADSNVYISALNFGGIAEEVLTLGRAQKVQLFVSPPILIEVEGVLIRKFRWSAKRARQAIAAIKDFAQVIRPKEIITLINEDEPDNRILECAVEANAEVVITGDEHLRQLKTFRGMPIVSPGEFLETYRAQGHQS